MDEVNQCSISPEVYQQMYHQELVYAPYRKTHLDMWLSYIAFIYDLHFKESIKYIKDNHWIDRSFDRLHPTHQETYEQYQILKQKALDFIEKKGLI